MTAEQAFWQAEYLSVSNQAPQFLAIYIQAIIVYFSVMGLLLKFALANNDSRTGSPSPALKVVLSLFALICCELFWYCTKLADKVIKAAQGKREHALQQLGYGITKDLFGAGFFVNKVCYTFNVFAIIAWVFMISYILYNHKDEFSGSDQVFMSCMGLLSIVLPLFLLTGR